jgi:thiamine phosphate synthase YjbQ (UPF0047 family)
MPEFKVTNVRHIFSTKGGIDFIDLTDEVHSAVAKSNIRNGIVHVFAPHATGIIILTENDAALLDDIRDFLEEIVPTTKNYNHPSNLIRICGPFCCNRTGRYQLWMGELNLELGNLYFS